MELEEGGISSVPVRVLILGEGKAEATIFVLSSARKGQVESSIKGGKVSGGRNGQKGDFLTIWGKKRREPTMFESRSQPDYQLLQPPQYKDAFKREVYH